MQGEARVLFYWSVSRHNPWEGITSGNLWSWFKPQYADLLYSCCYKHGQTHTHTETHWHYTHKQMHRPLHAGSVRAACVVYRGRSTVVTEMDGVFMKLTLYIFLLWPSVALYTCSRLCVCVRASSVCYYRWLICFLCSILKRQEVCECERVWPWVTERLAMGVASKERIPVKVTAPRLTGCYSPRERRQSTCQPPCTTASLAS